MATRETLRVLIVDDDEATARSLCRLVANWGFTAVFALNGATALTVAATLRPNVVLLDLYLPDQHGYEVAKALQQSAPEGRMPWFVAVTGWGQPADLARSTAAGIPHHLVKPVNEEALRAILAGYQNTLDLTSAKADAAQ